MKRQTSAVSFLVFMVFILRLNAAENLCSSKVLDSSFALFSSGKILDAFDVVQTLNASTDSTQNPQLKACIHTYLGNYAYTLSRYTDAIRFHHYARIYYEQTSNALKTATACNNIGTIFQKLNRHETALEQHLKALEILSKHEAPEQEAMLYTNLGNDYEELGKYEISLAYHRKALALDSTHQNLEGISADYVNIGVLLGHLGDYRSALIYHRKCLAIDLHLGDTLGAANALHNIGFSYQKMGMADSAIYYGRAGLRKMGNLPSPEIKRQLHELLSRAYDQQRQHDSAFKYQRLLEITEKDLNLSHQSSDAYLLHLALAQLPRKHADQLEDNAPETHFFGVKYIIIYAVLIILIITVLTLTLLIFLNKL
jgi:tetratricopeptide (TPR) repeat protein